ncbi:MAG: DNA cytosine methyltransferase [Actinomycetota bacterium]|nr:DNA cytosine methyltransferase [Actinomycetota bacterium]
MSGIVIDLFAAGGGWDVAAAQLGLRPVGFEWDWAACLTGKEAGHVRVQADVAAVPTEPMRGKVSGVIGSPPCTLLSDAGHGMARLVLTDLCVGASRILAGEPDVIPAVREQVYPVALAEQAKRNSKRTPEKRWSDERVRAAAMSDAFTACLILEPARFIYDLRPEWVALEQVPAALPVWQAYVHGLTALGYSVWARVLNAANYGVPQTRERAILGASRVQTVSPPPPTHAKGGRPADLFGGEGLRDWVSMASALGWGATARPAPTITSGGTASGGAEPLAKGGREALAREAGGGALARSRSGSIGVRA